MTVAPFPDWRPKGTSPADASTDPVLDPAQLEHLLSIVGPDHALALLNQMRADLQAVRKALAEALGTDDPPLARTRIREQTHVLIALAGAVGARHLQTGAETLNRLAHAEQAAIPAALAQDIDAMLARTIAYLARRAAQ